VPGRTATSSTVSTAAAPPSRTSRVPFDDQPESIKALPNGPDKPNATDEVTARANPATLLCRTAPPARTVTKADGNGDPKKTWLDAERTEAGR
jgi:hypothetical protein